MVLRIRLILIMLLISSTLCSYCANPPDSLFRVKRIRSKGDYFIIHAERNDSLFKIISKKIQGVRPNLEEIKRGKYYFFIFGDSSKQTLGNIEPLKGRMNNLDFRPKSIFRPKPTFIDGTTKIRFTKRFHYKLYPARNLIGLYYIPPR